jgi:hypothetical protein
VQDHIAIDAIDVIECKSTSQLASYDARSMSLASQPRSARLSGAVQDYLVGGILRFLVATRR